VVRGPSSGGPVRPVVVVQWWSPYSGGPVRPVVVVQWWSPYSGDELPGHL